MIVYVVTTYSKKGRQVKAVFEDRAQAIYYCALFEQDDAEIDEMDTGAIRISGNKKPLHEWAVFVSPELIVKDMGLRYTFRESRTHDVDSDGSVTVYMTLDMGVPEDKVKEIAIDYVRQLKK